MESRRDAAWLAIAGTLDFTVTPGDTGAGDFLTALQVLPDGQTLVAVGWGGVFARSVNGGANWTSGDTGAENDLSAVQVLPDGLTLVAVGEDGVFARSVNGGADWTFGDTGAGNHLYDVQGLPDGQTLVAVGSGGIFARSVNGGADWTPGNTGAGDYLTTLQVLPDGQTLVAVGDGGAFAIIDDWNSANLTDIAAQPGADDDVAYEGALAALPERVLVASETADAVAAFRNIVGEHAGLERDLAEAQARRSEIQLGGLDRAQSEAEFEIFMQTCRGAEPTADLTKPCVDGFAELQKLNTTSIWQSLADRVPPAILLLFLLATLGGLCRYDLRLAGFHASRADLLELMRMQPDLFDRPVGEGQSPTMTQLAMRWPPTRWSSARPIRRPIRRWRSRRRSSTARADRAVRCALCLQNNQSISVSAR